MRPYWIKIKSKIKIKNSLPRPPAVNGYAEGNGKYTSADRCRFFDNARGSTLECAACLDVLVAKSLIDQTVAMKGKEMLIEIVSMLVGLIRSNSPSRDV